MRKIFIVMIIALVSTCAKAQTFEIRAVNKDKGIIGVEIRITAGTPLDTSNAVTDIVFGLKWQSSYNVDLVNTISTNYHIIKSGVRQLKNEYHYQAFSATSTPFKIPSDWQLNEWVEIMTIANTRTGTGTGTFEIAEPGFDITTNPNFGVDLIDYTPVINGSAMNVILPVHIIRFEATIQYRKIKILWTTTNEQNSKGFEIERSEGEAETFKKIGWMDSKSNASRHNEYGFTDEKVSANTKYYYRLRQLDLDGKYTYSDVRTAIIDGFDNKAISIRPNPATDVLSAFFDNTVARGPATFQVTDTKGSIVITRQNNIEASNKIDLDVSGLSTGQYFLLIRKNNAVIYLKSFQKH